jgi:hypothetical protein
LLDVTLVVCFIDSSLSELIHSIFTAVQKKEKNNSSGSFSKSLFQGSKLHLHLLRYSMARFFGVQHKLPTPAQGPQVESDKGKLWELGWNKME